MPKMEKKTLLQFLSSLREDGIKVYVKNYDAYQFMCELKKYSLKAFEQLDIEDQSTLLNAYCYVYLQ